jgi:hypothetical protein
MLVPSASVAPLPPKLLAHWVAPVLSSFRAKVFFLVASLFEVMAGAGVKSGPALSDELVKYPAR